MKKNKKKLFNRENKEKIYTKARALERESNITLISTSVAIVSFFLLIYVHNSITTNYVAATQFLSVTEVILLLASVVCAAVAIWKKKSFLWEYAIFGIVLTIAYYLLENGAAGIPGLVKDTGDTFTVTPLAMKLSAILTSKHIIYFLWAVNVLYCIYAIVIHSLKYSKIKKGNN